MSQASFGQHNLNVKGTVQTTSGELLGAVTITVKNNNIHTLSAADGTFNISIPSATDTLVFSYVGYEVEEIAVDNRSFLSVQLKKIDTSLNDVIVVGYGTQKKSDLTGSIVSLSGKDLKNNAVSNVSELIQGKAAGVYVSTGSGQPGQNSVVRIRGFGTVNSNDPIYVVDGQIFDNINSLNPSDIANIEVLKDASATAIYGSRGSNGVILVTTKKGQSGEPITSLDAYVGQKSNVKGYDMANSDQFYNFMKEAYENAGQTIDPKFTAQYQKGYSTDWWKAVSQKGFDQNYNASVSSGGKKSRTYYSLGYYNDNGAIITTKYKRISIKVNNEYDISSHITVGEHLGISKDEYTDDGNLPAFSQILNADPFTPVINPLVDKSDPNYQYDKYAPTEWGFNPNPVAMLRIDSRLNKSLNVFGNVYGTVRITDALSYFVQYNFEDNRTTFKLFQPEYHSVFSDDNLANQDGKFRDQTQLTNNSGEVNNYVIEQRLNYKKSFGKHNIDAMVAMTYEDDESEGINAFKTNAPGNDEAFQVLDAATMNDLVSGGKVENSILSYLGRINYSYSDRYLATINFRADGSSIFADGHKWGYFPSFSLGWRINNEDFFKNSNLGNFISDLKLRAGWGQTGNQNISRTAAINLIGTATESQYYFGTGYSQGYYPTNVGNPDIKWETSQQTNIGLDAGFFEQKLTFSADYYIKKTKGMLLQVPMPAIASFVTTPFTNAGNVQNTGFEATIGYKNNVGQFNYSIGANVSTYKTTVTSLGNGNAPLYGSASKTMVGGPMGRFFGYVYDGIFQNQQEIDNYKGTDGQLIQPNAVPGDFKFADINHDGVLNDQDRTFIGNPNPKLIYGFNLSGNYKGFDIVAYFQGVWGNDIYNSAKLLAPPGFQNTLAAAYTDAWKQEGDHASYPRISLTSGNDNFRASSWYVESGSYLRLQNVQLGYNLPASMLQKSHVINSCRIYIGGQNLLTITKYSGPDPDIGSTSPLNIGYDPVRYPSGRTFTIGLNAQF